MPNPFAELVAYLIGVVVMPFAAIFGSAWPWAFGVCTFLGLFLWFWSRFCSVFSRHEAEVHKAFLEYQKREGK